ncbi:MAG: hypothetical protein ACI4VX_03940, partial [Succinivibrionaceae bacterium]
LYIGNYKVVEKKNCIDRSDNKVIFTTRFAIAGTNQLRKKEKLIQAHNNRYQNNFTQLSR